MWRCIGLQDRSWFAPKQLRMGAEAGAVCLSVPISIHMLRYTRSLHLTAALKSAILPLDEHSLLLLVLQRTWEKSRVNKLELLEKTSLFILPLET